MSSTESATKVRRWPWLVMLALGVGLVLAPAVFQMFSRAPKGGDMINEFRPYMTEQKITTFQRYMSEIDAAVVESRTRLNPEVTQRLGIDKTERDRRYPLYADFDRKWPAINADMSDMLRTMRGDLPNFAAVDALPPFPLFPWFFVIPGVLIAAAAVWGLARGRRGASITGPVILLVVLGLGLVAAPAVFQMFTRAPKGGDMINDFRPLMTEKKVSTIQGYFLVIGSGEGTIRNEVLPALAEPGADPSEVAARFPAFSHFAQEWPTISNEMAPMIGAMSDNLDNYAAVAALPPFPLFPWFFVLPGLLVAGFALAAWRPSLVARRTTTAVAVATSK